MKRIIVTVLLVGALLALTGCDKALPDVKGMTPDQAEKALVAAGFKLDTVTYDDAAEGAPGAVIAQRPKAGERAKAETPVGVTVAGPPPVVTPTLDRLSVSKAKKVLAAVGLVLGDVTRRYDDSAVARTVISQDPALGVEVPAGSAVAIVVSKGPTPVPVPNVTGKPEAKATKLLEKAGFKVEAVSVENPGEIGTVVSQKPASGKAQPGTAVVITVSIGIDMVEVPRVVGMHAPEAESTLGAAGLQVLMVVHNGPAGTIDGDPADILEVYKQSPAAGSLVPMHSTVRIYWWSEAS